MTELPWFPLWVADFTNSRSVRTMTPAQVGVYILLLCSQWNDGPIPEDESQWPGLTNNADLNDVRTVVQRSFVKRSTGWVNERLERVRNDQVQRAERLSEAGRVAGKASGQVRRNKAVGTVVERSLNDSRTKHERKRTSQSQSKKQITTTDNYSLGASVDAPEEWPLKPRQVAGRFMYPKSFELIWAAYPDRQGPPGKHEAYRAVRARVTAGADPTAMLESAKHYKTFSVQNGKEGTEFIKQAATFFGPREAWREFLEPVQANGRHVQTNGHVLTPAEQRELMRKRNEA